MNYIKRNDYKILSDKVKSGDAEARDFMMNYMNLPDEEANAKLSKIIGKDNGDTVQFLIKDELEAIQGYDKGILQRKSQGKDTKVFEKIKADEYRHIEMLKGVKD